MSSVRARSAATAPVKKMRRRLEDDRQAQQELPDVAVDARTASAARVPSSSVPTIDHRTIGIVKASATRKRLRMSRTIASIDMPA